MGSRQDQAFIMIRFDWQSEIVCGAMRPIEHVRGHQGEAALPAGEQSEVLHLPADEGHRPHAPERHLPQGHQA